MQIPQDILDKLTPRTVSDVIGVCLHHTVTHKDVTAAEIAAMEPFLTIGYNVLIRKDPQTGWQFQEGRPFLYVPAAQYGLNVEYYAIAIAGNYQPGAASWLDAVEKDALDLVVTRVHQLREHYGVHLSLQYLIGHRDVAAIKAKESLDPAYFSTACPGANLYAQLDKLREYTGLKNPLA